MTVYYKKSDPIKDLHKAWIEQLEERYYLQTFGFLRTGEYYTERNILSLSYCALGVLLDIAYPDGWICNDSQSVSGPDRKYKIYYHRRSDGEDGIEEETLKELGLTLEHQRDIMELNDKGKTFREISKYIEDNLL